MRRRFGKVLSKIAEKDKKIVLLVGDIGFGIFDDFRRNHPKRQPASLHGIAARRAVCFKYLHSTAWQKLVSTNHRP